MAPVDRLPSRTTLATPAICRWLPIWLPKSLRRMTNSRKVESKARAWLEAGVRLVLVVDPQTRSIREYRSRTQIRVYDEGTIDLGDIVPGFRLDVAEVFRFSRRQKPRCHCRNAGRGAKYGSEPLLCGGSCCERTLLDRSLRGSGLAGSYRRRSMYFRPGIHRTV